MQALRKAMRNLFSREAIFAFLLSLLLAGTSSVHFSPRTPIGVHCPTAVVQWVETGLNHQVRKPQLGEKTFLQCHCAEKKAAQKAIPQTKEREEWLLLTVVVPDRFDWSVSELPVSKLDLP